MAVLIYLCIAACKKGNRYWVWNVNGEDFSTNEVEEVEGKARSALSTINKENGFGLTTMYFDEGTTYIGCNSPDPSLMCVVFITGASLIMQSLLFLLLH
jgi:hypothetical protein